MALLSAGCHVVRYILHNDPLCALIIVWLLYNVCAFFSRHEDVVILLYYVLRRQLLIYHAKLRRHIFSFVNFIVEHRTVINVILVAALFLVIFLIFIKFL